MGGSASASAAYRCSPCRAVIGVLVDDAIVGSENIERHLRNGGTPRKNDIAATQEIGLAVVATTHDAGRADVPATAFIGDVPA